MFHFYLEFNFFINIACTVILTLTELTFFSLRLFTYLDIALGPPRGKTVVPSSEGGDAFSVWECGENFLVCPLPFWILIASFCLSNYRVCS